MLCVFESALFFRKYELSLNSCFNVNPTEVASERASWNPIDVNIINPTFQHFHRVPAMFTPSKTFGRTGKYYFGGFLMFEIF